MPLALTSSPAPSISSSWCSARRRCWKRWTCAAAPTRPSTRRHRWSRRQRKWRTRGSNNAGIRWRWSRSWDSWRAVVPRRSLRSVPVGLHCPSQRGVFASKALALRLRDEVCATMKRGAVPLPLACPALQLVEPADRLQRRQLVYRQSLQLLHQRVWLGGEERGLHGFGHHHLTPGLAPALRIALALQLFQHLRRAPYHLAWDAGELRHVDAVALIRAARHDLAQEDHLAVLFRHGDVAGAYSRQRAGKLHQLMVVRGEERLGATAFVVVQILDNGPRDGQSIVGARAASDLVENDEAARRGVMQNVRRLDHLHHEGALARGEVVLGANACEDAIH